MRRVNIPIALLSLAISVLLWLVVFAQGARPTMTREYVVRLTPDAIKAERWAITKIPDSIRVSVTAPEARFARLNPETFVALADLSKATAGTRNYPVQVFPAALRELISGGPMSVPVEIQPIDQRRVAVVIETKGELSDPSLTLQSIVSDPTRVVVSGPSSAVEAVDRVRGFLDLGEVSFGPGSSANVPLEALDKNGRVLDGVRTEPLFARVRLGVAAAPEQKPVLVAPTFRGAPAAGYAPAGYDLTPTQLAVRGRSVTIAALSKVPTEPIDLSGLTADRTFDVAVRLPDGVRTVGPARVKVTVRIRRATAAPDATNAPTGSPSRRASEEAQNAPGTNAPGTNAPGTNAGAGVTVPPETTTP